MPDDQPAIAIGPGCFINAQKTTINYEGVNYQRYDNLALLKLMATVEWRRRQQRDQTIADIHEAITWMTDTLDDDTPYQAVLAVIQAVLNEPDHHPLPSSGGVLWCPTCEMPWDESHPDTGQP